MPHSISEAAIPLPPEKLPVWKLKAHRSTPGKPPKNEVLPVQLGPDCELRQNNGEFKVQVHPDYTRGIRGCYEHEIECLRKDFEKAVVQRDEANSRISSLERAIRDANAQLQTERKSHNETVIAAADQAKSFWTVMASGFAIGVVFAVVILAVLAAGGVFR